MSLIYVYLRIQDDTLINGEITNATTVFDTTFTLSLDETTISTTSTLSTNSAAKQLDMRSPIDSHLTSPLNISAISVQSNISSKSIEMSAKVQI